RGPAGRRALVSVTLLLQPGAPEAALGVRVLLPRTAFPVLHFVPPDEVAIISPTDHVIGHVIDKILLREFVPDRQALGLVGLFHVLVDQLFILGRANPGDVADRRFAADAANVLLDSDERRAHTAGAVHGNVELTGNSLLNELGSGQVLDRELNARLSRLADDRLRPWVILTLRRSESDRLA